ncbi:hypothetical protein KIN20_012111 [Parelaphostrongylus tenuis]|uniref:Uncharacterized protein n=1 Tax=Parelaphostrongylus tenuis TaxID=148309 RepID=A0AAD5QQB2_PARTN|nr:hypothetical protein KIN20_012111 [Parelaphostrongylus tenuis]
MAESRALYTGQRRSVVTLMRVLQNLRKETSDQKAFCQVEEHRRALAVRFVTTFPISSTSDHRRTPDIRYCSERKSSGERTTQEMIPLSMMYPPVYDLFEFVVKLLNNRRNVNTVPVECWI